VNGTLYLLAPRFNASNFDGFAGDAGAGASSGNSIK
jgi:hypothetical protein